jgi:hypothetical protein
MAETDLEELKSGAARAADEAAAGRSYAVMDAG